MYFANHTQATMSLTSEDEELWNNAVGYFYCIHIIVKFLAIFLLGNVAIRIK